MKKLNYSKCLLWLFVVGSMLSCSNDAEIAKVGVTFNYNYEGAPSATTKTFNSGSKIDTPKTPTRLDYAFKGWNTKSDGTGTSFDFEKPVTENLALYAKWEIVTYFVTFNNNYKDAPAVTRQAANSGSKINTPPPPIQAGYTFKAWNSKADGTGTDFNFETTTITENITLYANWIQTFTVTFNYNYTEASAPTKELIEVNKKVNKPTADPSRSDYTFKEWNLKADGTGTPFDFETTTIKEDITLYAKWEIITYTVAFNDNYTLAPKATTQTANSGSKIKTPTTPTRSEHTFKGWNTKSDGSGTDFNFETTTITENITLYAKWEIITYTVTFNYNYTGAPAIVTQPTNSGLKVNAPKAVPTRASFTISSWNTKSDGSGTDFNFETTTITANLTLYAKWEIITYTVTFNKNYTGAPAATTEPVEINKKANKPTVAPSRLNYSFKEWSLKADGTGTPFDFENTTITENITLYAQWKIIAYTVTFNYNYAGAPIPTAQNVDSGQKVNKIVDPQGYKVTSWNRKADGSGTEFNFENTAITGDLNLYAQWLYYPLNKSALQALLFTQNVDPTKIDIGRVTDMSELFKGKTTFNKDISSWDTSKVTNMQSMFESASAFNQDISKWNTSKVTNMWSMFESASAFNQDILGWNTSEVTTMRSMFESASAFNQDILGWNTSKVTTMQSMFSGATAFNGDISTWNTSRVTNMASIFTGATIFNGDISAWNTSNVAAMSAMFYNAIAFDRDISTWDTSKVTTMGLMFSGATIFNQDISKWNTSNVSEMSFMFRDTKAFNQDLSKWNTSKVTSQYGDIFKGSLMENKACQWPVAFRPAGTTGCLIKYPVTFNYNYNGAPEAFIQKVTTGQKAKAPTTPPTRSGYALVAWNSKADGTADTDFNFKIGTITENITLYARWVKIFTVSFNYNYAGAPAVAPRPTNNISKISKPLAPTRSGYILKTWNSKADGTGTDFNFETTTVTENITLYAKWAKIFTVIFNYNYNETPITQSVTSGQKAKRPTDPEGYKVTSWHSKADGSGAGFNFETTPITEDITLYAKWLYYPLNKSALQALLFTQNVDPTKIDTGRITDMSELFKGKTTFNKDISSWDTSKVTTMQSMFENTTAFNQDLSTWNTSSVTNMYSMFYKASAFNGNISRWNTSKVTTMGSMFAEATIFNSDISAWNTSSVFNMHTMFYKASAFNSDLSKWDTSSATIILGMFYQASIFNSDISAWNTSSVSNMGSMFYQAKAFDQDLSNWNTSKINDFDSAEMFKETLMENKPCQWPAVFRPAGTTCLVKYTVSFNNNYADAKVAVTQKVTTGQKAKAPTTTPTRSDYIFKEWNLKADGTGTIFSFETTSITEDLTLYAQWEAIAYTVTFNYNYAGATPATVPQPVNSGAKVSKPAVPNRSGYTIKTWNNKADGTGSTFDFETTTIKEDITLYAQWTQTFTVTFNYNYGGAPLPIVKNINSGEKVNKIADPESYKVTSWHSKADGSGTDFNFETTTITEDITLYAQWLYYPLNKSALQALLFTQNVNPTKIDTGQITDMSELFKDNTTFNGDISGWDTSKVTAMNSMFKNANAFNQDISKWNTSRVTNMDSMFYQASTFNSDISKWNTSRVTNMDSMFYEASAFNSNISGWNTSEVTNMNFLLYKANAFNQNLSPWVVSRVSKRTSLFNSSLMLNKPCQWPVAFRPAGTSCTP